MRVTYTTQQNVLAIVSLLSVVSAERVAFPDFLWLPQSFGGEPFNCAFPQFAVKAAAECLRVSECGDFSLSIGSSQCLNREPEQGVVLTSGDAFLFRDVTMEFESNVYDRIKVRCAVDALESSECVEIVKGFFPTIDRTKKVVLKVIRDENMPTAAPITARPVARPTIPPTTSPTSYSTTTQPTVKPASWPTTEPTVKPTIAQGMETPAPTRVQGVIVETPAPTRVQGVVIDTPAPTKAPQGVVVETPAPTKAPQEVVVETPAPTKAPQATIDETSAPTKAPHEQDAADSEDALFPPPSNNVPYDETDDGAKKKVPAEEPTTNDTENLILTIAVVIIFSLTFVLVLGIIVFCFKRSGRSCRGKPAKQHCGETAASPTHGNSENSDEEMGTPNSGTRHVVEADVDLDHGSVSSLSTYGYDVASSALGSQWSYQWSMPHHFEPRSSELILVGTDKDELSDSDSDSSSTDYSASYADSTRYDEFSVDKKNEFYSQHGKASLSEYKPDKASVSDDISEGSIDVDNCSGEEMFEVSCKGDGPRQSRSSTVSSHGSRSAAPKLEQPSWSRQAALSMKGNTSSGLVPATVSPIGGSVVSAVSASSLSCSAAVDPSGYRLPGNDEDERRAGDLASI